MGDNSEVIFWVGFGLGICDSGDSGDARGYRNCGD
jgi:hypothetical protein